MPEKLIFRKEAVKRISTPDELTDYLHVTNPSVWIILSVVIVLLVGVFAWSTVGMLESTVDVNAYVQDGIARVNAVGKTPAEFKEGMILRLEGQESTIERIERNEYGWLTGYSAVALPDGTYNGSIVTDSVKPISFLMESR